MESKWVKESKKIEEMLKEGFTLKEIGDKYKVSKQRIHQIISSIGAIPRTIRGASKKAEDKRQKKKIDYYNINGFFPEEKEKYYSPEGKKISLLLSSAKQRAKERGIPFDLKLADLYPFPKECPVYGFTLDYLNGTKADRWKSPSLDRIDNNKGYTKENTKIISWKANYYKSDGKIEDFLLLTDYLTKFKN